MGLDGNPTYKTLTERNSEMVIAIPPRSTAVASNTTGQPTQRDQHLEMIQNKGRLAWQTALNYGQRALVETMMGCYKNGVLQKADWTSSSGSRIGCTEDGSIDRCCRS
ncbi:hypothetical protein SK355_12010 (plasmid) [Candidatus Fukatsuia symbiotica]|uniref:Uncharacterized protein n=1 Tax=Candidatus Fukatsuia symbiotica TaxID=1878942 RepID=A0A2U8I8H7_9GAMM|nr:hypothetical protein [Candidatus Fukatsuia symbiotica]AWK15506.1 hypothetical protein CCS41_13835 [Candidatus Fukatsuia symbiotica]MEA9445899.1 hypothetical protein [Candidatus Fukatsuia symbiotica]